MTRQEIEARIAELRSEFHHCGVCCHRKACTAAQMCALGEISEEEESLRLQLKEGDQA